MTCDPGSGFPVQRVGCPDVEPDTGWLTATDSRHTLTPFRTLRNGAAGEAFARAHGVEYPFANDYFDAPDGATHPIEISADAVCTGSILVGHEEPLRDHVVNCDELVDVAQRQRVPVAIWLAGGVVLQVSELYRP